jgi:hypothetical protein
MCRADRLNPQSLTALAHAVKIFLASMSISGAARADGAIFPVRVYAKIDSA